MHPAIEGILIMFVVVGISYGICLAFWNGKLREWFEWLNPYNTKIGIVDGRVLRAMEANKAQADTRAARDEEEQLAWVEANGRIDEALAELRAQEAMPNVDTRRSGAQLRVHRDIIEGAITAGAAAPDAEFIRRYGASRTMTLETLEKLIEVRQQKDPDYESGY